MERGIGMTGAQSLVNALEKESVKLVYGYPGAAICPFMDSINIVCKQLWNNWGQIFNHWRYGHNVGITEDPAVSRITIVVSGDENTVEQVEKQLGKLIDVIKVKVLSRSEFISEELIFIKVGCTGANRSEIVQIADIFGAKIIDVSRNLLTLKFSGTGSIIESLEDMLKPYGIKEEVRTGTIAIEKGFSNDKDLSSEKGGTSIKTSKQEE
jgi:acetolactate synthase-1/3 small subunit